jgi:hypothetical protein
VEDALEAEVDGDGDGVAGLAALSDQCRAELPSLVVAERGEVGHLRAP